MAKGLRSKRMQKNKRLKVKRLSHWEAQKLMNIVNQLKEHVEGSTIGDDDLASLEQQAAMLQNQGGKVVVSIDNNDDGEATNSVPASKPAIKKKIRAAARAEAAQADSPAAPAAKAASSSSSSASTEPATPRRSARRKSSRASDDAN